MTAAALTARLAALAPFERDAILRNSWQEADHLAAELETSVAEIQSICRSMNAPTAERFVWLAALTQACGAGLISQKGLLVGLALFQRFNDVSVYAWPSQESIARQVGWAVTSKRNVITGLDQLVGLGAIVRVAARHCPPDVARAIFAPKAQGGSGRDVRGLAYKRLPPEAWQNSDRWSVRTPNKVASSTTLNLKAKPLLASPDSSPSNRVSISNVESVEPYLMGSDVNESLLAHEGGSDVIRRSSSV